MCLSLNMIGTETETRCVAIARGQDMSPVAPLHETPSSSLLGAKYSTPEINTSEIIVDCQWHFPMDVQWHFPMESHFSAVCPKGLSFVQWMFTGIAQWAFGGISDGFSCL